MTQALSSNTRAHEDQMRQSFDEDSYYDAIEDPDQQTRDLAQSAASVDGDDTLQSNSDEEESRIDEADAAEEQTVGRV